MENIRTITKECMETDKRVQILLSTYNGAEYLREQLDSYIAQSFFKQCSVLIRDDGSTDATVDILHEYERRYGFQVFSGENVGVNRSYQWLIDHADLKCDYFALSDQDDVWFPDKIERAVAALQSESDTKPLLYASRSLVTDAELNPIGSSLQPIKGVSFYNAMLQNVCPGHTQVFNKLMLSMLRGQRCSEMVVLDWWIYLLAAGVGKVYFEDDYSVKHRQHGGNAIGYGVGFGKLFRSRLHRFLSGDTCKMGRQLNGFYEAYARFITIENKQELVLFLNSMDSFPSRVSYILHCKVYRQTRYETLVFKFLYLIGKYRFKRIDKT